MAPKALARFSDRELRHLKPRATAYGDGLWFRVRAPGRADGFFRYAVTEAERTADPTLGKERWMPLGFYPDTPLAEFRDQATEGRKLRRQGIDPIKARNTRRAAQPAAASKRTMTLDQCRDGYLADHEKK